MADAERLKTDAGAPEEAEVEQEGATVHNLDDRRAPETGHEAEEDFTQVRTYQNPHFEDLFARRAQDRQARMAAEGQAMLEAAYEGMDHSGGLG